MNADEHRTIREMLGAYVLGQLDGPERSAVQAHLDGCPACQAEVAELTPLVAALADVDPARLGALPSPPADLGDRVVQRVRTGSRDVRSSRFLRRGAAGLLLAAAVVSAFVLGGLTAPQPTTPAAPPVQTLQVRLAVDGVEADAGLVRHTWGTELQLEATGLAQGGVYSVTFTSDEGTLVPGGTFLGTGDNPLRCSLNAALPLDDAASVTVADATGAVVMDASVA